MIPSLLVAVVTTVIVFQAAPPQTQNDLRANAPAQTPASSPAPAPGPAQLTPETRADIFMARKMYREAIEMYRQAPDSAVIANKIGIAYHQLGNELEMARKNYERAIKLDHKYAEAINNLGTVYYARKSFRRAIGEYKKALRISPDSASILSNLGTAYFARKNYELASEMYQKALALDPEVFERRSTQGVLLQDRNVEERAKFHYYLAKTYAKAGKNDLAIVYIRKALEEGFKERNKFQQEPEFSALQQDPEFKKLMETEPKVL
jgi:tetratricopeptide (TPR) repeat protein